MPDPAAAAAESRRVVRPGGVVGAYVWDYADGMVFLKEFWDAAVELDPRAASLHEGRRFPLARRHGVAGAFAAAGLAAVEVTALEVSTRFASFDDLWSPFLGGVGPAPSYATSLSKKARDRLRTALDDRLAREPDGSIALSARAWATRAVRP